MAQIFARNTVDDSGTSEFGGMYAVVVSEKIHL